MSLALPLALRCPCGGSRFETASTYTAPPEGETRFDLGGVPYRRAYERCITCGHWLARHDLDLARLYERGYVDATYGGPEGMRARFERILALSPERSDNAGRVARVTAFATARWGDPRPRRLLDVGAGLGVFPAAMKAAGWNVTATEPDPRTAEHLRNVVGVTAHAVPIEALDPALTGSFDLIAFNKVLEHVADPVTMLAASRRLLASAGLVYVEVPDVAAAQAGPGREEFFIEHLHVFSPASLVLLGERAGLAVLAAERLTEPSTKFTLRGFFAAGPAVGS